LRNVKKKKTVYNPQFWQDKPLVKSNRNYIGAATKIYHGKITRKPDYINPTGQRYPLSILEFDKTNYEKSLPNETAKPLALMEYLVKTYTNEGDIVCDPFMGTGTTGVACAKLGRRFVGIERDKEFFGCAIERIKNAKEERWIVN
jgi:site-specific DNA-methyltransferase (adenine-specific)